MVSSLPSFISRQVLDANYFFLNLNPNDSAEFGVSCGGMEKCSPDYEVVRSDFGFVGIEYVVSGRARVSMGGTSFELRPGSLFGYLPHTEIKIENSGLYPLTKYFVDLHGEQAISLFENSPLGELRVLEFAGVRWVEEVFRQMVKFGSRGGSKAERSCSLLAEHLLLQIEEVESEGEGGGSAAYHSYRRCRDLIEKRFAEMNSVGELAGLVRLDQAYISRLFSRFDEESPYKKLIRLKMNQAARLLFRESVMVKNAAEAVGFEDAAHFSRVFKNTYGVSPLHFASSVGRGKLKTREAQEHPAKLRFKGAEL
ncbi:AraC family transcriptional regulator [Pelagicoccus sp. SDUM812002]|uniref:helix-turn-helix transcriptional regulator n=1 Tax=Pelagicoccus sp. SDUM812002 TaxID=3041266 RepID=UPI00280D8A62|nr:AraC family transcriptional regulator [Pelagicoccus sp. SDUM812002]MDQ8184447.1 AraC family transcriptional regulator [Pelagicoccus sp. SDUM812002]